MYEALDVYSINVNQTDYKFQITREALNNMKICVENGQEKYVFLKE